MKDYEKSGVFYLGRKYDMAKKELGDLLLYDSKGSGDPRRVRGNDR